MIKKPEPGKPLQEYIDTLIQVVNDLEKRVEYLENKDHLRGIVQSNMPFNYGGDL